ncbi:MAG: UbiX family flavin prenyltransferase [Phycisphaerales bacterium]|jgi:4-hydroxy-3-polyprenylbenzoate decarboxylase|nr:UbiX family flavin prenyltransferase [Phycisphaerales bacterium]
MHNKKIVVGITGASGAPYTKRVIQLLTEFGVEVHVAVSSLGRRLLFEESNITALDSDQFGVDEHLFIVHNDKDLGASIASGSFLHDGMIVVPCSSNTLGSIANGITNTLVQRAAAVTLKEGRPLVLAHRESPISLVDIENLATLSRAGAKIAPLSPGFYMEPRSISDLIDFMAGKLVDLVGIHHDLPVRWS